MGENNCICYNALQKFYSALKNLSNFSINNNIIDNISSLDCFFSEFRNITFVLQKDFSENCMRSEYESKCSRYLKNDEMHWFVSKRNNITKQSPIKLEKNIIFEIYMPDDRIIIESEKLKVDFDEAFNITESFIKEILIDNFGMVDVFYSTRIIFKENNENIDLFPKIILGIETMLKFIKDIIHLDEDNLHIYDNFIRKIEKLYESIVLTEETFIHDYYTENNIIKSVDNNIQWYLKNDMSLKKINQYRTPINNEWLGKEYDTNVIFEKFELMHILIFNQQNNEIVPVFMILYKDFSMQMIPIHGSFKTTIYRTIYEIVDNIDFKEVLSIFYCGEMYVYNYEEISDIINLEYSRRVNKANCTVLSFFHINNSGKIKQVMFNTEQIKCDRYIVNKLSENIEFEDIDEYYFLNPITRKFKSLDK